jgi:hypothetical protein
VKLAGTGGVVRQALQGSHPYLVAIPLSPFMPIISVSELWSLSLPLRVDMMVSGAGRPVLAVEASTSNA